MAYCSGRTDGTSWFRGRKHKTPDTVSRALEISIDRGEAVAFVESAMLCGCRRYSNSVVGHCHSSLPAMLAIVILILRDAAFPRLLSLLSDASTPPLYA